MNRPGALPHLLTWSVICSLVPCALATAQVCDTPLTCSAPSPGEGCVSGQLYDLETGEPVREASPSGTACTLPTASGPCSIDVTAFDSLEFFSFPLGSAPLSSNVVVDDCGYYVVSEFPIPGLGFVAIATDDAAMSSSRVLTAISMPISDGSQLNDTSLYSALSTSDQAWTASAGDPFAGQTFSEKGVLVGIFLNDSLPAQGTVLTRNGGVEPGDDYYFEDASPLVRSTVDSSQNATGMNGTALMVDSGLVGHSGSGGEFQGCVWPAQLGDSVPGVIVVQEFHSVDSTSGEPCNTAVLPLQISIPLVTSLLISAVASLRNGKQPAA